MTIPTTARQVLFDARAYLKQPRRWTNDDGFVGIREYRGEEVHCYCLGGAIGFAANGSSHDRSCVPVMDPGTPTTLAMRMVATAINPELLHAPDWHIENEIYAWNDNPKRLKREVIAVLNRAIDLDEELRYA